MDTKTIEKVANYNVIFAVVGIFFVILSVVTDYVMAGIGVVITLVLVIIVNVDFKKTAIKIANRYAEAQVAVLNQSIDKSVERSNEIKAMRESSPRDF